MSSNDQLEEDVDRPESALVILVPEAEWLIEPYRRRFDSEEELGLPAHITILYPFVPPDQISLSVVSRVSKLCRDTSPFDFALSRLDRFPAVLYLSPEPEEPFRSLTNRILAEFPDHPPYENKFPDIVPHLTIANIDEESELNRIGSHFALNAGPHLPIFARATEISLMEYNRRIWRMRYAFKLGPI